MEPNESLLKSLAASRAAWNVRLDDPWDRPTDFWLHDEMTSKRLVWRPRLWWDTYLSQYDAWIVDDPLDPFVRLFVDPLHGIKQLGKLGQAWFEPLDMDGHRVAILRMRVALAGPESLVERLRHEARFLFTIGDQEFVCAALGDIEDWYTFSPLLYIPPRQSFYGLLQAGFDLAVAITRSTRNSDGDVTVRVTFDIRYGREVL